MQQENILIISSIWIIKILILFHLDFVGEILTLISDVALNLI